MNIKKDVTKAFKKMLTSNHMRTTHNSAMNNRNTEESFIQSTMFGGSQGKDDNQSQ
jgi:hypothetical protein